MYLNDFSVKVIGGKEESNTGYVTIESGKHYKLSLRNNKDVRCDAKVEIDGKLVGTWRILANSNIVIERPADEAKKFIAFAEGTLGYDKSQGDSISKDNRGLIQVTFIPEAVYTCFSYPITWTYQDPITHNSYIASTTDNSSYVTNYVASCSTSKSTSAVTGLQGKSNQTFTNADYILHDFSQETVISLRLICEKEIEDITPLKCLRNPVPPPIQ